MDTPREDAATIDAPTLIALSPSPGGDHGISRCGKERYLATGVLGRGGMGEVTSCVDGVIEREVAMKMLRPELEGDTEARARFVAEARVQGRLEHPAIVPVYDLAEGASNAPYFVMKRVRGLTLDEIIEGLARGDARTASFGLRKLLAAFCSVCMAVDYAHSRGVAHRDLKPSNVMLGDFGEVYALDWGVATTIEPERGCEKPPSGAIVGTPGYIPPEQLVGESRGSARGDVFALGAILFEILTRSPLVARGNVTTMIGATLAGPDAEPKLRANDVAPELVAICVRATARAPGDRFASARALCEAVERYLEGDRDLERRRAAAAEHAARAEEALKTALAGDVPFEDGRARAMKELNRALALDPDNNGAMRTMVRLLTEAPREVPAEVRDRARVADGETLKMGARLSGYTPLLYLPMIPILAWLGVRDWWIVAGVLAAATGAGIAGQLVSRRSPEATVSRWQYAIFGLRAAGLLLLTRMFGPLVMMPTLAAAFGVAMQVHPAKVTRHVGAWVACLIVGVPTLLEWAKILPASYGFEGGKMYILPQMHELPPAPTAVLLLLASVGTIATASVFVGRIRRELSNAHLRLQLTAWHLERLLPEESAAPKA